MNGLNLARAFDEKDFRDAFVRRVEPLLKKGERLGLPAVLGFYSSTESLAGFARQMGGEIFEVPCPLLRFPACVLFNMLKDHLRERECGSWWGSRP